MFISIDVSRAAALSPSAACATRSRCSPLVHGRKKRPAERAETPFQASIAVRKNYRSPWPASAQYRVVSLGIGPMPYLAAAGPRCLTGLGAAPILPHRKNGLKSRKHKAF